MIKIGIVILNFKNYNDTINCIEDFLSQKKENYDIKISVVDNHSPNESYSILMNKYCNNEDVIISQTQENLGFANGNNFGLEQLDNINFNYDFIICSNDDIRLNNKNIYDWVLEEYKKKKFALLGPDIYSLKNKYHQSPMADFSTNLKEVNLWLFKAHIKLLFLYALPLSLYLKLFDKINYSCSNTWNKYQDNVTLQGAFIVFSKEYFKFYDSLFDKGTFLYMEEHILKVRCDKKNLRIVYSPNYTVDHLEGISTNMINKSIKKKKVIRFKREVKSTKVYKNVLIRG